MRKPVWQPPEMIPLVLRISNDMLDSSKEQLINMKAILRRFEFGKRGAKNSLRMQGRRRRRLHRVAGGG